MLLLPILLLAELPPVTPDDLSLELRASKATILLGEPTKVVMTWLAKRPVQVVVGSESLWIDSGQGYRKYAEAGPEITTVAANTNLKPADLLRTQYLIGIEETPEPARVPSMRFAFGAAGRYRAKVQYDAVDSNELLIDVTAPSSRDAELFNQYLKPRPELLTVWVTEDSLARDVDELAVTYANNAYLARPLLLRAEARFGEAASADIKAGVAPSTGEARRVLEDLKALDLSATAFGEDHLLLIAKLSEEVYELAQVREAYEAVIERYPNGVAAVTAKEWLDENVADRTAPVLNVTTSPASLWPPNHKLVPITITVSVSDDTDPTPSVKLVSVTCNDACDPAQDIAGAALNTDDRDFQLRAERTGGGAGRTYTMTYSATDASGNTATAQATVIVPHDQR